jgi:hypothetical protein
VILCKFLGNFFMLKNISSYATVDFQLVTMYEKREEFFILLVFHVKLNSLICYQLCHEANIFYGLVS